MLLVFGALRVVFSRVTPILSTKPMATYTTPSGVSHDVPPSIELFVHSVGPNSLCGRNISSCDPDQ